jgi:hypothetical protein
MKIDITDINAAFSPSIEITDPKKFIGRYEEIESAILSLTTDGAFISIFGLRGIGKSSIANQIKLIAEGDKTLPKNLHLEYLLPRKGFNYIVHLVSCDEFVKDIPALIKRILYGDDKNSSIFHHNKNGDKRLASFKEKNKIAGGVNGGVFKGDVHREDEKTFETHISDDLIQQFRLALSTTQKDNQKKDGLLILIDEFDIISDKTGFASLIKSCTSKFVKFGIVGIGSNVEELIENHSSIGRQITNILVNPMPSNELRQIIKVAIDSLKGAIIFEKEVEEAMIKDSEGFPYFIHLLGKELLLETFKKQRKIATLETYDHIKKRLTEGKISITQEFRYCSLCRTSSETELMLKLFALAEQNYILTEDIYDQAREIYDLTKPSQYMDTLLNSTEISPVLTFSRDKRHVRFSDPIFKIYAKIRKPLHKTHDI